MSTLIPLILFFSFGVITMLALKFRSERDELRTVLLQSWERHDDLIVEHAKLCEKLRQLESDEAQLAQDASHEVGP